MSKLNAAEEVRKQIESAFLTNTYPGDKKLVIDGEEDPECRFIKLNLIGKHWQDLLQEPHFTAVHNVSLSFMTDKAFIYYLPAFLIASLDWYEADMLGITTIFELAPPPLGSLSLERAKKFNKMQKDAIRSFFKFLCDEYSEEFPDKLPQRALDKYWDNP